MVFIPTFKAGPPQVESGGQGDDTPAEVRGADADETPAELIESEDEPPPAAAVAQPVDSELSAIARWLGDGVAARLHGGGRYHVVELQDLPTIASTPARSIWASCTDELGCMTLLGDRARARISLAARVAAPEGGALPVEVRIYDLDWGEEVEGLSVRLPWIAPSVDTPTPSEPPGTPAPGAGGQSPWPQEALEALVVAIDARLLPIAASAAAQASLAAAQATPAPAEAQALADRELESQLDSLAAKVVDQAQGGRRLYADETRGLNLDDDEREMLGMSPDQYLRYKKAGWSEEEWHQRQRGRTGDVALRIGGGAASGELAELYDGIILIGDVATEVVEKYARLVPAPGAGMVGQLGVAVGVLADLEVEARVGLTRTVSEVRTLQTFAERYPCVAGPACPKVENIDTRVLLLEAHARYYLRRPWLLRPYASVGAAALRIQDIPDAYTDFSSTEFPSAYDPFPALWTLGVIGAPGISYELAPGVHFFAEAPIYLRLLSSAYDPLHFWAVAPEVEDPQRPPIRPGVFSLRFGLHVRLNRW